MKSKKLTIAMLLAALLLGVVPTAIASIDGRDSEVPGTPTPTTTPPVPEDSGPDTDDDRARDVVHPDDVIVDGSLCTGFDCVNGESFGFDTIRLKENNLRIHFDDTSNSASFPDNDWRIVINESANGGAEFFAIQDATSGRQVFRIEARAPSNSLYVDDGGRIGLGTANPVLNLHTVTGNTPALRLEQNGSSGFTAQTFDIAANEASFFIRDATNGSTLPFRIRPGAPSSSIDIAAGGNIGFGTSSPTASMHLKRTDGTAVLKVEETSVTKTNRQVLQLVNNGGAQFSFNNGVNEWRAGTDNAGTVRIDVLDGAGDIEFRLDTDGNLEIAGTLTENSDVNAKHDIQQMDAAAILASVLGLQVSEWSYNGETVRHIGPMAQDFAAAFGLGAKTTSIATRDIAGVALLSIQALAAENAELKARVDSLEQRLAELEAKVDAG
jgi:hypothetical protein